MDQLKQDEDLTPEEVEKIMHLAREAKNRRADGVDIRPDYKRRGSLFIRPIYFRPMNTFPHLEQT